MISINVFSEEKAWSKRLKNKDIFFKKICKAFPKKYKFLNKKITFTYILHFDILCHMKYVSCSNQIGFKFNLNCKTVFQQSIIRDSY